MKKIFISVFSLMLVLLLSSCGENTEETTAAEETHPPVEITTSAPIPLNEMSPDTADTALPGTVKIKTKDINFKKLEKIEAEDSCFPESSFDEIYKGDKVQYFVDEATKKINGVFFDEKDIIEASAIYSTESGFIEFYGDDTASWYFDKDGKIRYYVYTYSFEGNIAPIYTFYDAEGNKEATRTMGGWYDSELNPLSQEETLAIIQKYSATIEASKKY